MAQTLRQIVSDLAQDVRALNLDDRISFRYLANKFRDRFSVFLRVEARSREIFGHAGIWQPINCIELEDAAVTSCGIINDCFTLKRSTIELPELFATNYGLLLKVLTIDGLKEFKVLTQSFDYESYVTREYGVNKNVCWLQEKRLYFPNTTIDSVKALVVPKDPTEVAKLNGSCSVCTSPLEAELNYPDYLVTLAKQEIVKDLANGYKRITEDEKGDDNTNRK